MLICISRVTEVESTVTVANFINNAEPLVSFLCRGQQAISAMIMYSVTSIKFAYCRSDAPINWCELCSKPCSRVPGYGMEYSHNQLRFTTRWAIMPEGVDTLRPI